MSSILGIALMIASCYFLGQNIIFTSQYYSAWWKQTPATFAVLSLILGIASLTVWRSTMGNIGWGFVAVGIILVFLSGGVILQPTSMWTLMCSMFSFACGYQLLTRGRVRF